MCFLTAFAFASVKAGLVTPPEPEGSVGAVPVAVEWTSPGLGLPWMVGSAHPYSTARLWAQGRGQAQRVCFVLPPEQTLGTVSVGSGCSEKHPAKETGIRGGGTAVRTFWNSAPLDAGVGSSGRD